MTDVFISYSRADRPRVEKLAAALEAAGFDVWWDKNIAGGAQFSKETEAKAKAARAIVVVWSAASIESMWVADEATIGRDRRNLVPVAIDAVEAPIGFRQIQTIDFTGWKGGADAPEFAALRDALRPLAAAAAPASAPAANTAAPARTGARGADPKVIAGVLAALVLVAAVALFALRGQENDADAEAAAASPGAAHAQSIAVMPFLALSDDASDEYFGKGVAEELLNALAQFPELKVAARTSAFSFEGRDVDLRDVAEQLGVAHVVEGSVRRSGERLRVTAQLIRAEDGYHLWSNTYEREAPDIFAIEDEIVRDIARTLEVRLGVGAGAGRAADANIAPQAYEAYLQGLVLWGERSRSNDNRWKALQAFQTATSLEPDFADAWAAIGVAGAYSYAHTLKMTRAEYLRTTEAAFEKALALDPANAMAHSGLVNWRIAEPDIAAAGKHLEQALASAPNSADSHYAAAAYAMIVGDTDGAVAAFQRAIALDPLNVYMQRVHATFLSAIGRYDEAFAFNDACHASRCQAEGFPVYVFFQALFSKDPRRIEKWLPLYEQEEEIVEQIPAPVRPPQMFVMPAAISVLADRPDAERRIAEATAYLAENPLLEDVGMWGPALARRLPPDVLFDSMERAVEQGYFLRGAQATTPFYGTNPWPDEILRHPRYHAIWEMPGMPELAAARRANGWDEGLPLPVGGGE